MTILPQFLDQLLAHQEDGPQGGPPASPSPTPLGHGATAGASRTLDFGDPGDNLTAFGKLWGSFGAPAYGSFHGTMFAVVGDRRLQPLFGYTGTGVMQCKHLKNGSVRMRGKETGFFTDLASGDVLDCWDNPFTGKRVEVFDFLNDRMRGTLTTEMPRFHFGAEEDEATLLNDPGSETDRGNDSASVPFVLPWEVYGDAVLLAWDYAHRYTNPVTADRWPEACTGPYINPSEHFTFQTSLGELENPDCHSAAFHAGFSRTSPWWPWMHMGRSDVKGVLFGRMFSRKTHRGIEDVPRKLRAHVEKHHPEYLEAPDDWDDGMPMGTWEAYARQVPPEI